MNNCKAIGVIVGHFSVLSSHHYDLFEAIESFFKRNAPFVVQIKYCLYLTEHPSYNMEKTAKMLRMQPFVEELRVYGNKEMDISKRNDQSVFCLCFNDSKGVSSNKFPVFECETKKKIVFPFILNINDNHPDSKTSSDLFLTRFSPKKFSSEQIDMSILMEAIENARRSPSAGNLQAYDIILITNKEIIEQIYAFALEQSYFLECAGVFVFITNPELSGKKYKERGRLLYSLIDTTIACSHMQLALQQLGVSSRWIGAYHEKDIKLLLNINEQEKNIIGILVFGKCLESKPRSKRRDIRDYLRVIE